MIDADISRLALTWQLSMKSGYLTCASVPPLQTNLAEVDLIKSGHSTGPGLSRVITAKADTACNVVDASLNDRGVPDEFVGDPVIKS